MQHEMEYPFGQATQSFFLNGGDDERWRPHEKPLLAYGANGSPARLAAKLPGVRVAALAATLHDFAVVHSNHVSPYGAVPATVVPLAGARARVHVILVDDRAPLDATEPNYLLERLAPVRLEVERLGPLDAVDAYVSRWGPLRIAGDLVPLGTRSQHDLLEIARNDGLSSV